MIKPVPRAGSAGPSPARARQAGAGLVVSDRNAELLAETAAALRADAAAGGVSLAGRRCRPIWPQMQALAAGVHARAAAWTSS